MEIPPLKLLRTSMRLDSVLYRPLCLSCTTHTLSSVLSVSLPTASHIIKPVHQLFRQTIFSALSQSACPPGSPWGKQSFIRQHFRYSAGGYFVIGTSYMLDAFKTPNVTQVQQKCSMDTLGGKIFLKWRLKYYYIHEMVKCFNKFTERDFSHDTGPHRTTSCTAACRSRSAGILHAGSLACLAHGLLTQLNFPTKMLTMRKVHFIAFFTTFSRVLQHETWSGYR